MSELEIAYSDTEISENHSKLIEAVAKLDKKQRVNTAERSEPTLEVSEFHLVKSRTNNKDAVQIRDLVKSLGQKGYQSQIAKKLQSVQRKNKVISRPLEKSSAEKVRMKFGFERTLKDLSKWTAIVARNRTATCLSFPLRTSKQKLKTDSVDCANFIGRLRFKSDLQKKMEELEREERERNPKLKEPLPEEKGEKDKPQMTLKQMKTKRNEIAKRRAQQSYQEAKAHRQRKIKSKKFHRIERKKKDKEQLKEFEELQKSNPEKALMKLEQLDKSRAEERMSLRHKSTGQWAKNKQIRAKYNKETRQELAVQLSIGKELIQKVKRLTSNSDEDEALAFSKNNEKECNDGKVESEVNEFIERYQKYCNEKKKKSEEETVAKVDSESKSANKRKLDNMWEEQRKLQCILEEQISNEPNKAVDTSLLGDTNISTLTSQKIKKSIKDKKASKKTNTNCTVISDEIVSKKKKAKLYNEKSEDKVKNKHNAVATSTWHVEELQDNKKTDSKTSIIDVDDMLDSVKENIEHKFKLKMQKIKKKLETENKANKRKKEKNKENEDYIPNLEFKDFKQKSILDLPLEETTSNGNSQQDTDSISLKTIINTEQESADKQTSHVDIDINIDPQKYFINTKSIHLKTHVPNTDWDSDLEVTLDHNEQADEIYYRQMDEAFEDYDVEEEFKKEKEEEIKNSQPENINTYLPGWGSWVGTNIKERKVGRKNVRFIQKLPKDAPRKDENKGDVIIFEGKNQKLKEHLVSELPYPFTTVKDFEATMRAPLGRTFVPENAHRRLIQPSMITKSGQVIEPMTEDILKKQSTVKRRINKQKKDSIKNNNKKRE